jgi:hypothetical protein
MGLRKATKMVRIADESTDIRTENAPTTRLEHYRYANALDVTCISLQPSLAYVNQP